MRLHDSDSTPIVLPTINHTPDVPKPASLKPGQRVEWDWDVEHADRAREREADAAIHHAQPFEVDRRVLRDIVQEKMGEDVGRICFMGSGVFFHDPPFCRRKKNAERLLFPQARSIKYAHISFVVRVRSALRHTRAYSFLLRHI
jgi:hypothetical protein